MVEATGRLFGSGAAPQHELATVRGSRLDHAVAASGESLDRPPWNLVLLRLAEVDSIRLTALRDGEEAVAEFARDGYDRAFSPAANLDSVVEAAHLRVLADQDPGAFHEDAANDRVTLAGESSRVL